MATARSHSVARSQAELGLRHDLDVKRVGGVFEIDVRGLAGSYLVFETLTHDEVVVEDVEVLYGRGGWRS